MLYLDLFSGIGGFHLAAKNAGWSFDHTYHSEIVDYANAVYARHFPDAVQLGDIRGIDGRALRARHPGQEWVLTGGFPCQGISGAGCRRGLEDPRSGLWYEMRRIIEELQPTILVAENSPHLRTRGLTEVVRGLATIGYGVWWSPLSAGSVGAPHRRERLWVVASKDGIGSLADASLHVLGCERGVRRIAPSGRDLGDDPEPEQSIDRDGVWSDWTAELSRRTLEGRSWLRRVGDGLSRGVDSDWGDWQERGRCLGNAVVPHVAEVIFRLIEAAGLKPD